VVSAPDPVVEQRARIARYVKIAQRIGYLLLAVAIVAFVISFATDFPSWSVTLTIVSLILAIVILPLPIVFGYGVRAAEREERQGRAA
jgi:membrane protein YdbS with pleckstrin-like domain